MNRSQKAAAVAVALGTMGIGVLATVSWGGVRWNSTESAPAGLWRVVDRMPGRGEWVSFCPADTPLFREYQARGYIHSGPCPGGLEKVLKPVAAIAGDVVSIIGEGVSVNGAMLPDTAPQTQDSMGRPLVPGFVTVTVKTGELWVVSNHSPLSIDSRYFGPIGVASLEGVAVPVWVGR